MHVSSHRVMAAFHTFREQLPYLPEILRNNGYETAGFTGGGFISPGYGFQRGFELFISPCRFFHNSIPLVKQVLTQMIQKKKEPFFIFLHGYDVHTPFTSPHPFSKMITEEMFPERIVAESAIPSDVYEKDRTNLGFYQARYDNALRHADFQLSLFLNEINRHKIFSNTIFIFLSDHGEELMDHGAFTHQFRSLYGANMSVPMIIVGPNIPAGKIFDRQVRTIDLVPWILEHLNIDVPAQVDGNNFMSSPDREPPPEIFGENIVYNHLIMESKREVFLQNVYIRTGIIHTRSPDTPLLESISREFGAVKNLITPIDESTFIVDNKGSYYMQVKFCENDRQGSYLLTEWIGDVDVSLRDQLMACQGCESNPPKPPPDNWKKVEFDGYLFYLPEGHELVRDSNSIDIRRDNWKLIYNFVTGRSELFDLAMDPGEKRDMSSEYPMIVSELKSAVPDWKAYLGETRVNDESIRDTIDPATLQQLQELGYIGK